MPYIILKYVNSNDNKLPVIMLDINDEVWEFKDKEEAESKKEELLKKLK